MPRHDPQAYRDYMRAYMRQKRAKLAALLIAAETPVQRLRRANGDLTRDRDALQAHLSWHHDARPRDADILTRLERLEDHNSRLAERITILEAERAAVDAWDRQHAQEDVR